MTSPFRIFLFAVSEMALGCRVKFTFIKSSIISSRWLFRSSIEMSLKMRISE